ncbi:MAG TPA: ADP-ribosylglycohydrolase family protein [Gammaproteobacteria bacterium]|nr:crystallin J1 [Gammaproteobacteria bacterium]HBF07388.1 ADP-ribosylglycohydrolase family protein [Gammaproteobacteria bacterium]HCK91533.1 ADP-ribosylglycohydrolase family protein [Gammaproteobacteria bacterium]|tara:strand:+ start:2255 stop:3094 length:840 start_codon:yes stop_codon:yes gene_type:complete
MLKEIAIADAYGAGFEFSSPEKILNLNNLSGFSAHDLYGMNGKYTDDTQMSIAVAELLVSQTEWTSETIASKFVECFKRDPRKGYSKGFYALLNEVESGVELIKKLKNDSNRNGAAMRSVPLGYIKNKAELIVKAQAQAAVTHNTDTAIKSSCAVALAAHFGVHERGQLSQLPHFLESHRYSGWNYKWAGEVTMSAIDTVSAAFSCLISCQSLDALLKKCIALGGDTDSVASIAVGLATCFDEYDKTLPSGLLATLDEPVYGLEFLDALDKRLLEFAAK